MSNVLTEPYFQFPTAVVTSGKLARMTAGELRLYIYLLCEAQRYSNPVLPPDRTHALESQTSLASGTLKAARKALEEKGLILCHGGQGKPYTYTLCNSITREPLQRGAWEQSNSAGTGRKSTSKRFGKGTDLRDLSPEQYRKFYEHHLRLSFSAENQASANCPFHGDSHPSLEVNTSKGGGGWYCHACKIGGGVLEFQRRIADCDTREAIRQIATIVGDPSIARGARAYGKPEVEYTYVDEHGVILYAVERYEGRHNFRQKRLCGDRWIHKLGDVRRVLYHLPDVLNASHVIITEGKKDADNVDKLALIAEDGTRFAVTTCSEGAGKWRLEYAESLQGKQVIVLYDDDEPGMAHADDIRDSLEGIGVSAQLVGFREYGVKDVSDFLQEHSRDDLMRHIGLEHFEVFEPVEA